MTLDLFTVIALTALSAFLMGASILLASRIQFSSDPCMQSLGTSCLLQSVGWGFVGLRDQVPLALSVVGSNVGLLASSLCYLHAVNVFIAGSPPGQQSAVPRLQKPLWVVCGLFCAAVAWFLWPAPNLVARIMASALCQGYIDGFCAARLLGVRPLPKSRQVVGVGFALLTLAQVFRVVMAFLEPPTSAGAAALFASQAVTLISGYVAVVMLTFLFVLMVHDRAAHDLRELVNHDYLTGVFNRSAFESFARQAIEQARRSGEALSLLLFDVDHFKNINDTHGHLTGDVALRALAELSAQKLRSQDVLGRYGGEEFAVLLPATDAQGALLVAERVRESIAEEQFRDDSTPFRLTISIGIAQFPPEGQIATEQSSAEQSSTEQRLTALFRGADAALYEAKRSGRNRTLIASGDEQSRNSKNLPRDLSREG